MKGVDISTDPLGEIWSKESVVFASTATDVR